ncbi:hypothetical protein PO909_026815 [Leuciscus waleckii]
MAGEEEKLCELIRIHPHLYDSSSKLHSNKIALENAWREVATAMGKTVDKVKTDWKSARDKFTRAHKKWKVACRSGAGQLSFGYPKVLTQLSWLSEFIKHRTTESNFSVCKQRHVCSLSRATFTLQAETTQFRFFCPYATCI